MPKSKDDGPVIRAAKGDSSMMDSSMCPEEASEKIIAMENFLKDFDIQVKERLKGMESSMKKALSELTRLGNSEKMKLSKEIRNMTVKEFIEKGGDLETLELKELSMIINSTMDISFQDQPSGNETTVLSKRTASAANTPNRTVLKAKGKKDTLRETSLLQDALKKSTTRSQVTTKKTDYVTPVVRPIRNTRKFPNRAAPTPIITPKFDPTKPPKTAREPHLGGETLVSLSGSPVITGRRNTSAEQENTDLVSISMSTDQAVLGGKLFVDDAMSPNTLMVQKQVIEEAMSAINSRLEALNSQVGSKLDCT